MIQWSITNNNINASYWHTCQIRITPTENNL
jgi:hypothetical protein